MSEVSEGAMWSDEIIALAREFHDEYERQAARFGWVSQTPVPFDDLPESNMQTMLNTVARVMARVRKDERDHWQYCSECSDVVDNSVFACDATSCVYHYKESAK